ncbi:hypothetical protein [Ralstonia sp. UBA689]|uniref:hypothetical protein n=1 Tax=Ralstonia sp. UBA689 TaxID=1947373 RepID=UPI0025D76340|nr:hypothetical protein [Ralstonia sp. UBA689]
MNEETNLPLAVFKARLALTLQLVELLLVARQRWLAQGVDHLADDIDEIQAMYTELMGVSDWATLGALWPDAWWRASRHGVSVLEGLTRTALDNHTAAVGQAQQALKQWQQSVVQILHAAGNTMPFHGLLENTLLAITPAQVLWPTLQAPSDGAGKRAAAQ